MLVVPQRGAWFHEYAEHLGAMNVLSSLIANLEQKYANSVPNLRQQPTLLIGSDYSGSHQAAPFEITSLLITNFESLGPWDEQRTRLRGRFLPEKRRMSYKALNDGHRRAALMPFLNAANRIPGLLLSVAIDKNLSTIFNRELSDPTKPTRKEELFDGWKPATIERAMRTVHFASLLLRGLSNQEQDLWWFTDQDEIVANEQRLRSFVSVMGNVASHYLPHTLRHMRIGTTALDSGRRDIEDFVAIPDFAAGVLQETLNSSYARRLLNARSLFVPTSQEFGSKARRIMDWFADNSQPLRRLTFIFDEPEEGKPRITSVRFHGSRDEDATALVMLV
jgi:hypothetical protein